MTIKNYWAEVTIIFSVNFNSLKDPRIFWLSLFGLGLIKPAPGTVASLFTVVVWWFGLSVFQVSCQLVLLFAYIVMSILVFWSLPDTLKLEDPSEVVSDEFAGMWLALIFLPKEIVTAVGAFLVFRLLDIGKPLFIGWIDKNVHGGLGVMADDLVAGAVTALFMFMAVHFIAA